MERVKQKVSTLLSPITHKPEDVLSKTRKEGKDQKSVKANIGAGKQDLYFG
jgi:hypothetical protein